jgi:hypothetical protein
VDDLHQTLAVLRLQEGFEAYGSMSHGRRRGPAVQACPHHLAEFPQESEEALQPQDDGLADVYERAHKAAMKRAGELDTERRHQPTGRSEAVVSIDSGVLEGFGSDQSRLSMQDILEADRQATLRAHHVFMRGLVHA